MVGFVDEVDVGFHPVGFVPGGLVRFAVTCVQVEVHLEFVSSWAVCAPLKTAWMASKCSCPDAFCAELSLFGRSQTVGSDFLSVEEGEPFVSVLDSAVSLHLWRSLSFL